MEHQRDYGGRNTKVKTTLVCLDADVIPSPFPHLVICSSLPTEQVLYQCSNKFICAAICLADGAGAEYRHSPASTCACHDQELIDFMAGGEVCTQQEQQHLVPCLSPTVSRGKEGGEVRRRQRK